MKCRNAEKWISTQIMSGLPAARAAELEMHLADCAECRKRAERMQRSAAALRDTFAGENSPDLKAAVLARIRPPAHPRLLWWWGPAVAGVAVAAMLAVAPWLLQPRTAMSDQEVLQAYSEDISALNTANVATVDWTTDDNSGLYGAIASLPAEL